MTAVHMRRLLAAVVVSLLLHVLVLSGAWFRTPEPLPAPPPLEARLVSAPPPAAEPAALPPKPPHRRRPKAAPRRRTPPPLPVATVAAATPLAVPAQPQPPNPGPEPAETAAPAITAPETPPVTPSAPPAPTAAPASRLPRKGRITYTLYLGTDRFSVGKTVQSWEIEGGTYKLGSVSETTGIANLFSSQNLNYLSEGRINVGGLQPQAFLMSRKRRGETEVAKAIFDWASAQITLGKVQNRRTVVLPAGSQDMVSFIYQLAFAQPAPGRLRLPITNGSNLDMYELDVLQEENIETPIGTLKTLPVRQLHHPGEESIEFWLAPDYRYLPVKIRFIGRDGEQSGEQIVSEIHVSDD
jgi:hypothetical protein